jgi:hypothetical protein
VNPLKHEEAARALDQMDLSNIKSMPSEGQMASSLQLMPLLVTKIEYRIPIFANILRIWSISHFWFLPEPNMG